MYNLRILFTCLCAHVVRDDDALVILPDARLGCPPMREPQRPSHGGGDEEHAKHSVNSHTGREHHVMTPHVGAIQFDPDDLAESDEAAPPHMRYRGPSSPRETALYFLSGQDIHLEVDRSGAPAPSVGRVPRSTLPMTAVEEADLSWVAEIKNVDEAASYVDRDCLRVGSAAELDGRKRVLARIWLRDGRLSSAIVPRGGEDELPLIFGWKKLGKLAEPHKYEQSLSAAVAYDLPLEGNEATLNLTDFGGGSRSLRFSLAGRPFGYTLQLAIKNMPLESLLEVEKDIQPGRPDDVDHHFAMYYALSERPPADLWVPDRQFSRSGAPICPSSRFVQRPAEQP